MNPFEFFRNRMVAMVSHGFAFDGVHESLELKGASEVWGGPELDAHAAWYFWLERAPGAYQLRLSHADVLELGATPAMRGVFSVKYYPSPHEPAFRHFSAQEQALIEGDVFDDTNTPDMDAQDQVPENLFAIGTIEFTCDRDLETSFLKFTSLDTMRFEAANGAGGAATGLNGAAPTRELPTWDIGYRLFDAVTGLHALLTRKAPERVVLSEQPGFDFVETADGSLQDRDCVGVKLRSMLIGFRSDQTDAHAPLEEAMIARHRTSPWTPLIDTAAIGSGAFPPNGVHAHSPTCEHAHQAGPAGLMIGEAQLETPIALNAHWWTLAEDKQTANTLPCGCSSH